MRRRVSPRLRLTVTDPETASNEAGPASPNGLALAPNYPNPFNGFTTIRFGLAEDGPVRVDVYDLLGRRLATLLDGHQGEGWHEVRWDADRYSTGQYIYRIQTGDRQATGVMTLTK